MGLTSSFDKNALTTALANLRTPTQNRAVQALGLNSVGSALDTNLIASNLNNYTTQLHSISNPLNTTSLTWGWRNPISVVSAGNRLSYIHNHLSYITTSSQHSLNEARLLSDLHSSDKSTASLSD